jgi:hypothetical protein
VELARQVSARRGLSMGAELFEWVAQDPPLREWYEPDGDPREALGRMARRLRGGGALYLGGGIGVERVSRMQGQGAAQMRVDGYKLTPNGEAHDGPLSAVTAAFTKAGGSTEPDTPGGATTVTDPAIAARLHELDGAQREEEATIRRFTVRQQARAKSGVSVGSGYGSPYTVDDGGWEQRRMEEAQANITAIKAERARLLSGKPDKATEGEMEPRGLIGEPLLEAGKSPEPFSHSKTSNWVARAGGLPTFIQHVAHDILESKGGISTVSAAIAAAISQARKWAAKGNKEAAAAIAEWERKRAGNAAKGAGKAVTEEEFIAALELAEQRLALVDETLGEGASVRLAVSSVDGPAGALAETVRGDIELLAFVGDARAGLVVESTKWPQQARHRDGQWTNVLDRVRRRADAHPLEGPDRGLRLNTPHPEPEPVAESGLIGALLEARA